MTPSITATALAIEAMASFRNGDAAAARRALAESGRLLDEHFPGETRDWHDWLVADLLYREAVALIEAPKAAARVESRTTARP